MQQKTILLTGGNRGIGLEICRQLAAIGHCVYLGSRNKGKGEKAIKGFAGDIRIVELNVTDSSSIQLAFDIINKQQSSLDVLINNAGIINDKSTLQVPVEQTKKVFETNFFGAWETTQVFLPLLKNSSEGRIINLSSGMGALDDLNGGYAAYRLSKWAMNGLTMQFAAELSSTNIKVNSMCPGWVNTDMGGPGAPRTVSEGADTAIWLSTADEIPNGKFIRDRNVIPW
jgi:NAD(P)-dependent dehydrogenase (short-subunit alcohol dehydrogenase family)